MLFIGLNNKEFRSHYLQQCKSGEWLKGTIINRYLELIQ